MLICGYLQNIDDIDGVDGIDFLRSVGSTTQPASMVVISEF